MRVYIAGPMTGIKDYNFPAFHAAAAAWRQAGWDVVNPAELDKDVGTEQPWAFYLKRDLKLLVDCDAVAQLPGWQTSRGARLETYVATELGLKLYPAEDPVILRPLVTQSNTPKCIWCQTPTQRIGMCWSCPNCGATTSC